MGKRRRAGDGWSRYFGCFAGISSHTVLVDRDIVGLKYSMNDGNTFRDRGCSHSCKRGKELEMGSPHIDCGGYSAYSTIYVELISVIDG